MQYRGSEYTVVQGIERGVWKWSASVAGVLLIGKSDSRSAAVAAAEKAIHRAQSSKKRRTSPDVTDIRSAVEGEGSEKE